MLEFLDKHLAVINVVISVVFIIALYAIFGLLRKKIDKPRSFWLMYWALGSIVLLGALLLWSINIKLKYTFAGVAVGVMAGSDSLIYVGLMYFLAVLGVFYLWRKKLRKHISYCLTFWGLSIVLGYLLFKASIIIIKYCILLNYI